MSMNRDRLHGRIDALRGEVMMQHDAEYVKGYNEVINRTWPNVDEAIASHAEMYAYWTKVVD
jgi:hypothetical protein